MTAVWLKVALSALAPVSELRGAIPLGVYWGMSPWAAFGAAVVGNLAVIPLLLFGLPLFIRLANRVSFLKRIWEWAVNRARLRGEQKVQRYGALGLFFFTAIPLPVTGAWTACLLAVVLGVHPRYSIPAIGLGVLAGGVLVTLVTVGALEGFRIFLK